MAVDMNARVDIGRVINRTFGAIGGNFVNFLILAALFAGAPGLISYYLVGEVQRAIMENSYGGAGAGPVWTNLGLTLLSSLISVASSFVMVGAVSHSAVVFWNGRAASLGESISTSLRYLLPLIGAALLIGLCCGIGFILLVVPGVILSIMWSVASPSIVMEGAGITGAMQRSRDLTRGNRWRIFWLLVIFAVVTYILRIVILMPLGLASAQAQANAMFSGSLLGPMMIFTLVYAMCTSIVAAAGTAALYFELRVLKDGVSTDELAKIFE